MSVRAVQTRVSYEVLLLLLPLVFLADTFLMARPATNLCLARRHDVNRESPSRTNVTVEANLTH